MCTEGSTVFSRIRFFGDFFVQFSGISIFCKWELTKKLQIQFEEIADTVYDIESENQLISAPFALLTPCSVGKIWYSLLNKKTQTRMGFPVCVFSFTLMNLNMFLKRRYNLPHRTQKLRSGAAFWFCSHRHRKCQVRW